MSYLVNWTHNMRISVRENARDLSRRVHSAIRINRQACTSKLKLPHTDAHCRGPQPVCHSCTLAEVVAGFFGLEPHVRDTALFGLTPTNYRE